MTNFKESILDPFILNDPVLQEVFKIDDEDLLNNTIFKTFVLCEYMNRLYEKNGIEVTRIGRLEDFSDDEIRRMLLENINRVKRHYAEIDNKMKREDDLYPDFVKEDPLFNKLLSFNRRRRKYIKKREEKEYAYRLLKKNGLINDGYYDITFNYKPKYKRLFKNLSDIDLKDKIHFCIQRLEEEEKEEEDDDQLNEKAPRYVLQDDILNYNFRISNPNKKIPLFAFQRLARAISENEKI